MLPRHRKPFVQGTANNLQRHNRTTLCASHGDNFRIDLIADASGQYPLIYEGVLDKCEAVRVGKPIQALWNSCCLSGGPSADRLARSGRVSARLANRAAHSSQWVRLPDARPARWGGASVRSPRVMSPMPITQLATPVCAYSSEVTVWVSVWTWQWRPGA